MIIIRAILRLLQESEFERLGSTHTYLTPNQPKATGELHRPSTKHSVPRRTLTGVKRNIVQILS
jgi:hypothetical protein